jgi:hypothetical protein
LKYKLSSGSAKTDIEKFIFVMIIKSIWSRKCWAYSAVTDKQPSNVGIWYENLENEYNDGKYLNNQPVEDGFRRNEMRVL